LKSLVDDWTLPKDVAVSRTDVRRVAAKPASWENFAVENAKTKIALVGCLRGHRAWQTVRRPFASDKLCYSMMVINIKVRK
jgi:hypothetical protein